MKFKIGEKEITLFNWPTKPLAKWVISLFVIGFLTLVIVQECEGGDLEVGGGLAMAATFRPSAATAGTAVVRYVAWDRVEIAGRYFGEQDRADEYFAASASYRAVYDKYEFKPYLALGVAWAEDNTLLAQNFNFSLAGGARWRSLLFEVHHFSNAGMKEPNRGQNSYTLSYIWEF